MAAFEVLSLDTAIPQIRAPGAGDTYTFPRAVELPLGTASGVLYLNASNVVTSGSGLVFNGTNLGIGRDAASAITRLAVWKADGTGDIALWRLYGGTNNPGVILNLNETSNDITFNTTYSAGANPAYVWQQNGSERMRLNSTGLGIGTASPSHNLDVFSSSAAVTARVGSSWSNVTQIIQRADGSSEGKISFRTSTSENWGVGIFAGGANALEFRGGGTERMRLDSAGNLGLGVTPSAWGGGRKSLDIGSVTSLFDGSNFATSVAFNNFWNGSQFIYKQTTFASRYEQASGQHAWYNAASGTAGNAISFTQALTLDANRNLALNTTSVGTSAVGALSIGSGTEPSSGPADTVQFYSVDRSAGNTIPAFYCEGSGVTDAGITNTTVTHKIAMKIKGTVYYLLATTNAT